MARYLQRITCGSSHAFTDPDGGIWEPDEDASATGWGRVGGTEVRRPDILPVHPAPWGALLRTEAFGMRAYRIRVPPGTYAVRLVVAETFPSLRSLDRTYAVSIAGYPLAPSITPFAVGGGFGRGGHVLLRGVRVGDDGLELSFTGDAALVGLEVAEDDPGAPASVETAAWAPSAPPEVPSASASRSLPLHVVGNSGAFYWAIPESAARLVALRSDAVRLEVSAFYAGGKDARFFAESQEAAASIAAHGRGLVVLQDSSGGPLENPEDFRTHLPALIRRVRDAGGTPVLYAYSGPLRHSPAERRLLQARYDQLGGEQQVPVLPCAAALALAQEREPAWDFHDADERHLGIAGGCLMTCCWYLSLCGPDAPVPRDQGILAGHARLPSDVFQRLFGIAREACAGRGTGILAGSARANPG